MRRVAFRAGGGFLGLSFGFRQRRATMLPGTPRLPSLAGALFDWVWCGSVGVGADLIANLPDRSAAIFTDE